MTGEILAGSAVWAASLRSISHRTYGLLISEPIVKFRNGIIARDLQSNSPYF